MSLLDAPSSSAVDATVHARRGTVLVGLGVFQLWLWTTRLWNLVQDPEPRTAGFVTVHALLYTAAFGTAFVLLTFGTRMRREARSAGANESGPDR